MVLFRREESQEMAKRGHSEEAILRVLREAESGETVVEICRKHGISQQMFYSWKKQYAGLDAPGRGWCVCPVKVTACPLAFRGTDNQRCQEGS